METLFIGGIGIISIAVTALTTGKGWGVTLFNRSSEPVPEGMESMIVDIHDEAAMARIMEGRTHGVVAQSTAYGVESVQHGMWPSREETRQYIFINSAPVYQKPTVGCPITGNMLLINPYWEYSRKKIDAKEVLTAVYRKDGFLVMIVRPSHIHDGKKPPVAIYGHKKNWQILKRILGGKPIIIPEDGTPLWALAHSADFARGYAGLTGNPHVAGSAYHITSDGSMTWNQIYEAPAKTLDRPPNALHMASDLLAEYGKEYDFVGQPPGDKACIVLFDSIKIRRAVPDFVCAVSMAEGIRSSARYTTNHPESQIPGQQFDAWCDRITRV